MIGILYELSLNIFPVDTIFFLQLRYPRFMFKHGNRKTICQAGSLNVSEFIQLVGIVMLYQDHLLT